MTLLRVQELISNELAKRTILSRPPEPPHEFLLNDPTNSIFIGTTKVFSVPFTWSYTNVTNPHIAIVGITGSGKSFLVKSFLTRASYIWKTNAIIVDWAGEYISWVRQSGGTVISLSKGDSLNLMDLLGMKPIDRAKQIMNSLDILTDISEYPEQRRLTSEAIEQAYFNAGFSLVTPPEPDRESPTLKEVVKLLDEKFEEGTYAYPAELENAIYRLRQFAREGADYFASKSTIDIDKLTVSGLVDMDLSGLPDERFRALAAFFILQTLKEKMRATTWKAAVGIKVFIVLDEAWKVASDERSDAVTIIREGRKYSFGVIVASQNPTDVNEAIFSNVGTTFMLRIKFEKFMNYVQGSLNFSEFIRMEIGKLGVGQAAVDMSFNTAVKFPNVFLLENIAGETPVDLYTISVTSVLNPDEMADNAVPKRYAFDRIVLNSRLIREGVPTQTRSKIIKSIEDQNHNVDVLVLIQIMATDFISKDIILTFLRNLGLSDTVITRVLNYVK